MPPNMPYEWFDVKESNWTSLDEKIAIFTDVFRTLQASLDVCGSRWKW